MPSLLLLIQPTCLVLFNVDMLSWLRVNESFQLSNCKSALLFMFESVLPVDILQALNDVNQAKSVNVVVISKDQVKEYVLSNHPLPLSLNSNMLHVCLVPGYSN